MYIIFIAVDSEIKILLSNPINLSLKNYILLFVPTFWSS